MLSGLWSRYHPAYPGRPSRLDKQVQVRPGRLWPLVARAGSGYIRSLPFQTPKGVYFLSFFLLTGLAVPILCSLLAAGRFIKEGPVLQALSSTRFLAHSTAPLLALVGLGLAARAGVEWAEGGILTKVVTAAVAVTIGLSAFRNYFLLETRAICQLGVLRCVMCGLVSEWCPHPGCAKQFLNAQCVLSLGLLTRLMLWASRLSSRL